VRAYRLVKARYAASALDGAGARRCGGRWNSPGTSLVYASTSIALAALELLVHLHRSQVLAAYRVFTLSIPDGAVLRLDASALPADWRADPAPRTTATIGDGWIASANSLALRVPSTVIPREDNLLINPAHPHFSTVAAAADAEPFGFDRRLAGS
jgi:RES domain-containing protein